LFDGFKKTIHSSKVFETAKNQPLFDSEKDLKDLDPQVCDSEILENSIDPLSSK
jgi:hypothetical protein